MAVPIDVTPEVIAYAFQSDYRCSNTVAGRPVVRVASRREVAVMNGFSIGSWQQYAATAVMLLGVVLLWRGLHGGPNGERGLLRRHVAMLERLEGWRLTLLGLTLAGLGAGWFWEARWLLFLALGIGFVEIQEATRIIQAWRWSGATRREQRAP